MVGAGWRSQTHLRALAQLSDFAVVGLCDAVPQRSIQVAREFGIPRVGSSLESILDESADAVHICTPPVTHLALSELALRSGKHVFCEKPFGTDSAGAEKVINLAAQFGLVIQVGYQWRFDPFVLRLRDRFNAGVAGAPLRLSLHFHHHGGGRLPSAWRVADPRGCTLVSDLGSHLFNLAEFIGGHVRELSARITNTADGAAAMAHCSLVFETGLLGYCSFSWACGAGREVSIRADGTKGSLIFEDRLGRQQLQFITERGSDPTWQEGRVVSLYPRRGIGRRTRRGGAPKAPLRMDSGILQLAAFRKAIFSDSSSRPSGAVESLRTLRMIDAAHQSVATGQSVNIKCDQDERS